MLQLRRIAFVTCIFLLLSGCWDSRDIDQISFIVGSAFDKAPDGISDNKKNRVKLTIQSISHTPSDTESSNSKQKYQNISGIGDSKLEIIRQFALKSEHPGIGSHLKVTIISEKLLRDMNLQQLLSFHERTYEVRDSCIMLISKGVAANALKISAEVPSFELVGISANRYKTANLLPPMTHGKLQSLMEANTSFIVQTIQTHQKEIKFNGGALIKGDTKKLVGLLNEKEVKGLNWITGNIKGGIVKAKDPKTKGLLLYDITSVKNEIIPHIIKDHISFNVNIETKGRLNEDWVLAGNAFSNKFINRAELAIKAEIEKEISQTLKKLQKEYHIDAAGFGEQLRIHYPNQWKQMEKNWDKQFGEVPIKYQVKITISDYMVKGKKETSK
jgi:spore germination protein